MGLELLRLLQVDAHRTPLRQSQRVVSKPRCVLQYNSKMSLAQSRIQGPLGLKNYHSGKTSPKRPRFLKSMSFSAHAHGKLCENAETKLHGNATPQTPMHYSKRQTFALGDLLKDPHPKPWHTGPAPGKKESQDANHYHRVWITDMQRQGKWTRREKFAYYDKQDKDLRKSAPHDETMAVKHGATMSWTALRDCGSRVGGQDKLDITPPRQTGLHLKHGMYKGVYENVKPYQYVNKYGRRGEDGKLDQVIQDEREIVDTQLLDDVTNHDWRMTKWAKSASWDTFRPYHTDSCTVMGIHYTHR